MATEERKTSVTSEGKHDEEQEAEMKLLVYLQNILKYQLVPMNYMNLRKLVKEAPQNLKLYPYIQEKYPGSEFIIFLQKFPNIFTINPDNSVQIQGSSFCVHSSTDVKNESNYDEVDGCSRDRGEYESDYDSDSN